MHKWILIAIAIALVSCASAPKVAKNTDSKKGDQNTPTVSSTQNATKELEQFAADVLASWTLQHSNAKLRLVFNELDTNTDDAFAAVVRYEIEHIFLEQQEIILIARSDIEKILNESSFEASNFFSMNDIKPLKLENADAIIYGLLEDQGNGKASLTLSCLEYETARILARQSFVLPPAFPGYTDYLRRMENPLTSPDAPRVEERAKSVRLTWNAVRSYDAVYEVLRSESYDTEMLYSVVGKVSLDPKNMANQKTLEFIDTNLEQEKDYFYRIRYISRGKTSPMSPSVKARPYLPPPTIARISGSWNADMKATIVTWSVSDANAASFEYEATYGTHKLSGIVESPILTLRDYEPDQPFLVRIRAITSRGIKGEFSSWTTIPVPPATITELRAIQKEDVVQITWKYPETGKMPIFMIYVAQGTSDFTLAGKSQTCEFSYSGFPTGIRLQFRIIAINVEGLEGPPSETISLTTHTTPPVPTISSVKTASRFIIIEWNGPLFLDLKGYRLSVRNPDGKERVLYEGLSNSYTYHAEMQGVYAFSVISTNTAGEQSASASFEIEVPASAFKD